MLAIVVLAMSSRFKLPFRYPFQLPMTDILHRGLVWTLFGVSVWGLVMIGTVHRDKMRAGEGTFEALFLPAGRT